MIKKGEIILFTQDFYSDMMGIGRAKKDINKIRMAGELTKIIENLKGSGSIEMITYCNAHYERGLGAGEDLGVERWNEDTNTWDYPIVTVLDEVT